MRNGGRTDVALMAYDPDCVGGIYKVGVGEWVTTTTWVSPAPRRTGPARRQQREQATNIDMTEVVNDHFSNWTATERLAGVVMFLLAGQLGTEAVLYVASASFGAVFPYLFVRYGR
ncbi:hypothetical protein RQCS_62010 (plasmid) [Rhodococcus qingshengii]|nr:hypothetical protein RQCS_62010 [Rhodococcus qingshengii]